jgi:hypothetical protein
MTRDKKGDRKVEQKKKCEYWQKEKNNQEAFHGTHVDLPPRTNQWSLGYVVR